MQNRFVSVGHRQRITLGTPEGGRGLGSLLKARAEQSKEMLCLYSQGLKSEEVQLVLHMTAPGQLTKQALAASFPQPCTSKASFIFRNLST